MAYPNGMWKTVKHVIFCKDKECKEEGVLPEDDDFFLRNADDDCGFLTVRNCNTSGWLSLSCFADDTEKFALEKTPTKGAFYISTDGTRVQKYGSYVVWKGGDGGETIFRFHSP